jgi:hypothetical protein
MARGVSSIQAALDEVDAAISKAVVAQSYSVGGRSKSNQSLDVLNKRRDKLQMQLDRASGASPMLMRGVPKGLH